jgi:hypothetical protein
VAAAAVGPCSPSQRSGTHLLRHSGAGYIGTTNVCVDVGLFGARNKFTPLISLLEITAGGRCLTVGVNVKI